MRSASVTRRRFGVAVGEARRKSRATSSSGRRGASAQAAMKAAAGDRLTPA
jgi:hypothetical protein